MSWYLESAQRDMVILSPIATIRKLFKEQYNSSTYLLFGQHSLRETVQNSCAVAESDHRKIECSYCNIEREKFDLKLLI